MDQKLKYLLYARKSTEDKESQILSIQSQIEELEQCASRNNLNIALTLEESRSAAKEGRPVFNQAMNAIESGQANALLVWKYDRISRNEIDTGRVIKAFRDGILEEIRTPFETYKRGDSVLLLYIFFGQADEYSRNLSANVKRGNRTKVRLGQYPSKAPFGYKNYNRDNVKNIEPDENAPLVKNVFEWYASGEYSLSQVRDKINEELLLRNKKGRKFSKSVLVKMLKNRLYYGVIERYGELFPGSFDPVITKNLYDKVQEVRTNKSRPRPKKLQHAYKLLLTCGECDSKLSGETKHNFYPGTNNHAFYTYYSCSKKKGICSQKPIKESELESQLSFAMDTIDFDQKEWQIAVDLLKLDLDRGNEFQHSLIMKHQAQLAKLDFKLSSLLELRTNKEITAEEYLLKKNEYVDEKSALQGKIKELTVHFDDKFELVENYALVIMQAQDILDGDDIVKKRQLLLSVSSKVSIFDKKAEISFKKPFSFYFNREKSSEPYSKWTQEDSNF